MDKKIVFYGGGNMTEGILQCLLSKGTAEPKNITVCELVSSRCEYLAKTYGIKADPDVSDDIKSADMVIIAVTPPLVCAIAKTLNPLVKEDAIVMSIAAGISIKAIEEELKTGSKVVRIMPNTLNQSGNGYSAVCVNKYCDENAKALVYDIVSSLGQVMYLDDDKFDLFSAFSCTGPVWIYKTVEALINAGVHSGFGRAVSRDIVIQNMLGAAKILQSTGEHPAVKVDQMTAPAGSTIEALKVLEEEGFAASLMKSVQASVERTKAMK